MISARLVVHTRGYETAYLISTLADSEIPPISVGFPSIPNFGSSVRIEIWDISWQPTIWSKCTIGMPGLPPLPEVMPEPCQTQYNFHDILILR